MEEKQDGSNQLLMLCVICGKDPSGHNSNGLSSTEAPPVSESFLPSSALQKTLEILSTAAVNNLEHGSTFDKMNAYSVLTSPQGGLCCISCLVILHKGLEIAAQILHLESSIKNLASDIFSSGKSALSSSSVSKYSRMYSDHKSRPSIYNTVPPLNCNNNNYDIFSRFRNKTATSTTELTLRQTTKTSDTSGKQKLWLITINANTNQVRTFNNFRYLIGSEITSKSKKSAKIRTSPKIISEVEKKLCNNSNCVGESRERTNYRSTSNSSLERVHVKHPGVHNCPSCNFSVDIRTPSQKNTPLSSLSTSERHSLRYKAKTKVVTHFRANHMPFEADRKFHLLPDRKKVFLCPSSIKCSFTSFQYFHIVYHYMAIHVPEKYSRDDKDWLSCPEKSCTFQINIPRLSNGTRGYNSFKVAKYRLAIHVFREHDLPSKKPALEIVESPKKLSVLVSVSIVHEDEGEGGTATYTKIVNAYRCTRCNYIDIITPEKVSALEKVNRRNKFLNHFFDAHLKSDVPFIKRHQIVH